MGGESGFSTCVTVCALKEGARVPMTAFFVCVFFATLLHNFTSLLPSTRLRARLVVESTKGMCLRLCACACARACVVVLICLEGILVLFSHVSPSFAFLQYVVLCLCVCVGITSILFYVMPGPEVRGGF